MTVPATLGSGIVSSWLVPTLIFLILIGAGWAGLRWIRSEHIEALACTPLFSRLSRNTLRSILGSAHAVEFLPGDAVVREGERGKGFFVIEEGTARVLVGGTERARQRPGAYFGEIAVIDGGPRTATIAAETRAQPAVSPRRGLRLLLPRRT